MRFNYILSMKFPRSVIFLEACVFLLFISCATVFFDPFLIISRLFEVTLKLFRLIVFRFDKIVQKLFKRWYNSRVNVLSEDEKIWLQIFRSKNIGPISFSSLFKKYDPIRALAFLRSKNTEITSRESIEEEIQKTEEFGAKILFFTHKEYPKILLNYRDAPPFLIVKGRIELLNKRCISIVGSRSSSIHGNKITYDLAKDLQRAKYVIVSGMAKGIDRHAHLGAMSSIRSYQKCPNIAEKHDQNTKLPDQKSKELPKDPMHHSPAANTIAVLASGIDTIYPPENTDIYREIAQYGLLVSENPIGTAPISLLFHSRNRIVAAISEGIVIVEATKNSGSLITAQYALDYGKEIFCVPGCPLDPRSYGPNNLIKNGANLVQTSDDIISVLSNAPTDKTESIPFIDIKTSSSEIKQLIISALSNFPINIDELSAELQKPSHVIRQNLVELEIEGSIQHLPGDMVALML